MRRIWNRKELWKETSAVLAAAAAAAAVPAPADAAVNVAYCSFWVHFSIKPIYQPCSYMVNPCGCGLYSVT